MIRPQKLELLHRDRRALRDCRRRLARAPSPSTAARCARTPSARGQPRTASSGWPASWSAWEDLVALYNELVADVMDEVLAVALHMKVASIYERQPGDLDAGRRGLQRASWRSTRRTSTRSTPWSRSTCASRGHERAGRRDPQEGRDRAGGRGAQGPASSARRRSRRRCWRTWSRRSGVYQLVLDIDDWRPHGNRGPGAALLPPGALGEPQGQLRAQGGAGRGAWRRRSRSSTGSGALYEEQLDRRRSSHRDLPERARSGPRGPDGDPLAGPALPAGGALVRPAAGTGAPGRAGGPLARRGGPEAPHRKAVGARAGRPDPRGGDLPRGLDDRPEPRADAGRPGRHRPRGRRAGARGPGAGADLRAVVRVGKADRSLRGDGASTWTTRSARSSCCTRSPSSTSSELEDSAQRLRGLRPSACGRKAPTSRRSPHLERLAD